MNEASSTERGSFCTASQQSGDEIHSFLDWGGERDGVEMYWEEKKLYFHFSYMMNMGVGMWK